MSTLARLCVILILTLGFPLHNLVARVSAAAASECVVVVDRAADEDGGQAVPDKPSPSCKVIGPGQGAASQRLEWTSETVRFAEAQNTRSLWWPGGPEKPPKRG